MPGNRGYAVRKIQRFVRRRLVAKGMGLYRRKGMMIRKALGRGPDPTFVETFAKGQVTNGTGLIFKVRVTDIPQVGQYADLYTQYRINWIKVTLLPDYNSASGDQNSAGYNNSIGIPYSGQGRIAFAIQDSPNQVAPASEQAVLQDNGAKIKVLGSKWSCSFKPVPDVAQSTPAGNPIFTRQKFKQWFNFDTVTTGNNPEHGSCLAWITLPGSMGPPPVSMKYNVYYKVSVTFRDPK